VTKRTKLTKTDRIDGSERRQKGMSNSETGRGEAGGAKEAKPTKRAEMTEKKRNHGRRKPSPTVKRV